MARDLKFETNSVTHPFPPPVQIHGCTLAEPSGPWRLTFDLGRLKQFTFFIQIIYWAPRFHSFRALGFLEFSLRREAELTPWGRMMLKAQEGTDLYEMK